MSDKQVFSQVIIGISLGLVVGYVMLFVIPRERKPAVPVAQVAQEKQSFQQSLQIVTVDGCEYIRLVVGYWKDGFFHKGNCTNSIHIYRETK